MGTAIKEPQRTLLFRIIACLARSRLSYLVRTGKNPRVFVVLFAISAGTTALGTLTAVAHLTDLPLLFPPLAASSFVLFYSPMSEGASPRTLVLSHSMALFTGLASLYLFEAIFPKTGGGNPLALNWAQIGAIALAMGSTSMLIILFRCVHPPAAATALIASMGFITNPLQVSGYLAAVLLLVLVAFLLNRILGGLPYPFWQYDPKAVEDFQMFMGITDVKRSFWEQLSTRIFQRR